MSIGEALAQARRRAGLTVADVSRRTRIRQTIIAAIEDDDYSACGGDFYARGHIRAVAKVVGADPAPLISEYDALHRAGGAMSATSLDELLRVARSGSAPPQARAGGSGPGERSGSPAPPDWREAAAVHGLPGAGGPGGRAGPRRSGILLVVGVVLVAALGVGGYRLFAAPAGAAHAGRAGRRGPAAARQHAAASTRQPPAGAGGGNPPAPSPSAHASPQPRKLAPAGVAAFGPGGPAQGDNPQLAPLAVDGSQATAWHTDWYITARFGNLYSGTGLLLDMGRPVTITSARISLGAAGAGFQLRVGAAPRLADLTAVAGRASAGKVVRLRLRVPARGRYVLLWFTRLPPDAAGAYQAQVRDISLWGRV